MFSEYKKESIAQLYFSQNEDPDFKFCDNYFKITDFDVIKSLFKNRQNCGNKIRNNTEDIKLSNTQKDFFNLFKDKLKKTTILRDFLWCSNSWKTPKLTNWVEEFKPNVIFYVGGNFGFSHAIARFLANKFNLPLLVFFTDDYLIYPKNKNIFEYFQKIRIKKFYNNTINQAHLCFCIGTLMSEEYSKYFKKDFYPIMNSIKIDDYYDYNEKKNIVISYFGGLHLNRDYMLLKLAKLLPSDMSINLYTFSKLSNSFLLELEKSNITVKSPLHGIELKNAILDSDILLHIESDDIINNSLTKLSVSTKIPEYLMSGRLVLGFGPQEVASMRILSDNNIGIVIASNEKEEIVKQKLINIISNFKLRKEKGYEGYQYAKNNFNNQIIAKKFKKLIESL